MTRGSLRQELDKRNLDTAGSRSILIDRLKQALVQEELDHRNPPKVELDSVSDISLTSDKSSASSMASSRMLDAAKLAGLKARAASLRRKHELDKQAVELQVKREELYIEIEMGEVLAREAAYSGVPDSFGIARELNNITGPHGNSGTSTGRNPFCASAEESAAHPDPTNRARSNHRSERTIEPTYDHVTSLRLPTLEFSTFRGKSENYPSFMRAFQTNLASKSINEEEKLHYLLQYTADKPKEIVSTCLYLPPERGYAEAKRLLDRRYGNFAQMALGLVEKILAYPVIKSEDGEGLDSFAIHLRGSVNALKSLPHNAGSVDMKTIRALVDKLPFYIEEKWRRAVDNIEQTSSRQASFEDFVNFVEVEARIATNPSYGRLMFGTGPIRGNVRERRIEPTQHVAGTSRGKLLAGNLKASTRLPDMCLFCAQGHETHECPGLPEKTSEDTNQFIFGTISTESCRFGFTWHGRCQVC